MNLDSKEQRVPKSVQQENGLIKQDSRWKVNVQSVLLDTIRHQAKHRSLLTCAKHVLLENGRLKQDSHQTVSAPIAPLESTTTSRIKPRNLLASIAKKASTMITPHKLLKQIASRFLGLIREVVVLSSGAIGALTV